MRDPGVTGRGFVTIQFRGFVTEHSAEGGTFALLLGSAAITVHVDSNGPDDPLIRATTTSLRGCPGFKYHVADVFGATRGLARIDRRALGPPTGKWVVTSSSDGTA